MIKKLWIGVEVYGLIVSGVHAFWNEKLAEDWFKQYTGIEYSAYSADPDVMPEKYDQTKIFVVEV